MIVWKLCSGLKQTAINSTQFVKGETMGLK